MEWDRGLDYRRVYKELLRELREHLSRRAFTSFCYAIILLIQLRNGSKISEVLKVQGKSLGMH